MPAVRFGRVGGSITRKTRNTSRSTAISDSSVALTPRRDQARSEMQSRHLVFGRPLGRFPVGVDCSSKDLSCHSFLGHSGHMAKLTYSSWDLSIRRSGLTSRALRISDLFSLSQSVTTRTLRKYPISAVCSFDSIFSFVT